MHLCIYVCIYVSMCVSMYLTSTQVYSPGGGWRPKVRQPWIFYPLAWTSSYRCMCFVYFPLMLLSMCYLGRRVLACRLAPEAKLPVQVSTLCRMDDDTWTINIKLSSLFRFFWTVFAAVLDSPEHTERTSPPHVKPSWCKNATQLSSWKKNITGIFVCVRGFETCIYIYIPY